MLSQSPTIEDARAAASRLLGTAHRTPVLTSRSVDESVGARVHFKCENFQKGGAFKFRGALNAISLLDRQALDRGVVTHSSGNHGAAVALAAGLAGSDAKVVMPVSANRSKRAAVKAYGAKVIECAPTQAAREEAIARIVGEEGRIEVHPYDDAGIVAGQATAALELMEQVPDLELLVAPVGGGGLLAGTALAASASAHRISVWGAEPEQADDAARSFAAGHRIVDPSASVSTVADGLRAGIGAIPFSIIEKGVDTIVTVSEAAIIEAMRFLWQRMKIVVEPSSAVALAALSKRRDALRGRCVGVILSGGNVDLDALPWSSPAPSSPRRFAAEPSEQG
ncbi:MAG: threonine/serine dehydratase [Ectothiorhodospiraceae bacterium AqS1]|nr:threonine/serine dehydratase [Ectothiorhodospiraceae bacterium AqS1]